MCKYCEQLTRMNKMDGYDKPMRMDLPCSITSHQPWKPMVDILPPTPISKRRHQEDGLVSTLRVWVETPDKSAEIFIPIKYCPICGRNLSNDTE